MLWHTEIVPENVLSGSKNLRYSQNRATNYDFRQNLFVGINVLRHTEIVLKTYAPSRETPRYRQNRASDYDIRQNLLLGINVLWHTEAVPKNVLSGSKNRQVQSKPRFQL